MDGIDSPPQEPAEDEGAAPPGHGLAKEAEVLFQSGRFAECVEVLNQLLAKKDGDPKILHNIIVAEYFRDGCSDPRRLLDMLGKVKKRTEEFACDASGEQVENNLGTNATSGSKGSSTNLLQLSAAETGSNASDEFDTSIITLNTAIVLYHLHEYKHAFSLLEPLYQNIDPIDETTALHVCLLLLDIALASGDASKAAHVIQYLEKSLGVGYTMNQIDNGSNNQHQASNQGVKPSVLSNICSPDAASSDSNASTNITDNSLSGTLSDDALEYENLYSTLDGGGGPNFGRISSNDLAKAAVDRAAPVTELKLKMHLYKVRLLLLTRNLKATKREVKVAMNMARGRDLSTELHLKSQLEYARGNHRKAIKLLMTFSSRTEAGMLSMFNNNLGCIHYQLKTPHTSGLFFSRALKNSSSLRLEKPLKLSTFSQDKSLLIIYNCGLQNLSCGKPLVAAKCFGKASLIFYNRPVLWLHLAECCLSVLERGLLRSSSEEIRVHVVGSGRWRHLVVEDTIQRDGYSIEENGGQFKISLPFARYCLQNALILLQKDEQNATKTVSPSSTLASAGDSKTPNATSASLPVNSNGFSKEAKGGMSSTSSLLSSVATYEETQRDEQNATKTVSPSSTLASAGDSKTPNATSASLPVNSNGFSKEAKGGMSSTSSLLSSVATYEETQREENHMIRQAVIAALAYVELCLENPLRALSSAKSLIDLPECSKIYAFLGHVYAAESLCRLNRLKEAAVHLLIYLAAVNGDELPYTNEDRDKWSIKKGGGDGDDLNSLSTPKPAEETFGKVLTPEEARGITYLNLSTLFALQGDLEKARRFAAEAQFLLPKDSRVLLASVYLDLLEGKTTEPLSKLKQFGRVSYH